MRKYTQLNIRNKKFASKKAGRPAAQKMKLKKGDKVMVMSGKDKGKTGEIVRMFPRAGRLIIEGVAVHKRHSRAQRGQSGRIYDKSMPIDASNVMLMDSKAGKPTRVKRATGEDGKRVRMTVKSGTVLA